MTTTEAVVVERYALIHALRTAIRVYRKDAGGFATSATSRRRAGSTRTPTSARRWPTRSPRASTSSR
jgi:hypothetical protein